jgi:hypothetical protein
MKKTFLVLVLLFLAIASFAYSQSAAYKDYSWGMTVEQVKTKCSDLRLDVAPWMVPSYVLLFLYNSEFTSTLPSSLKFESGSISRYSSEKNELTFHFVGNKLVAVDVIFWGQNVINDLQKQYGTIKIINGTQRGDKTATWTKEQSRIIVWDYMGDVGIETVTYIDKKWIMDLCDKTIIDFRGGKAQTKSKLD